MRVLILGASGGVGKHLVQQSLDEGHEVTALVRAATAFVAPASLKVIRGEVLDEGALASALTGQEAVLSSLGMQRENPKNPWSKLTSTPDFCSRSAQKIVAAMKAAHVNTVIAVSAAGVAESAPTMSTLMKFFVKTSTVGTAYLDLAIMEEVYRNSGLSWCCPRPTRLTNGGKTGMAKTTDSFPMSAAISRADVAAWMLKCLQQRQFEPHTPTITVT